MSSKVQLRRDTAANWTSANPTLSAGEMGLETDTKKLKIGDGTTAWTSLMYSIPTLPTGAIVGTTDTQVLTNKTATGLALTAGTASVAPLDFNAGTNLSSPLAGAVEFDGANFYGTVDTSTGRGTLPVINMFKLTSAITGITATSTGTNFFGANSNIPLIANAFYEIEIEMWWLSTTLNIRNFSLIFNNAPTAYNVHYESSPLSGVVTPNTASATTLCGDAYNQTGATFTVSTATSVANGVNMRTKFKLYLQCGASTTSLKINCWTSTSGTITPGLGSYWSVKRLPATNVGTYAA